MSSTDWLKIVHKEQAKLYVLPEGWDTKETVAIKLGCQPERVRTLLEPAIKNKVVETQQFRVYDKETHRVTPVTAYRQVPAKPTKARPQASPQVGNHA